MDPIKARIQELCPDVMELKFGCKVKLLDYEKYPNAWGIYAGKQFWKSGEHDRELVIHPDGKLYPMDKKIEILGSPITLAVVLRAIERAKGITGYAVGQNGAFYFHGQELFKVPRWNLEHDYDQQSEECKQFIGSLLGV